VLVGLGDGAIELTTMMMMMMAELHAGHWSFVDDLRQRQTDRLTD